MLQNFTKKMSVQAAQNTIKPSIEKKIEKKVEEKKYSQPFIPANSTVRNSLNGNMKFIMPSSTKSSSTKHFLFEGGEESAHARNLKAALEQKTIARMRMEKRDNSEKGSLMGEKRQNHRI